MVLQLKQMFELPDQSMEVDVTAAEDKLNGCCSYLSFSAPLEIKGRIRSKSGIVTLDYSVKALLLQQCDRCLKEFEREYRFDFSRTLVREMANETDSSGDEFEDYVVCPDNTLDIFELALSDLLLSLPTKILCKEDCRGLCMKCGKDLNEGSCGCENEN